MENFQIYCVHISEQLKDSDGNQNDACIVAADFSLLWYINNPQHLKKDITLKEELYTNQCSSIVLPISMASVPCALQNCFAVMDTITVF